MSERELANDLSTDSRLECCCLPTVASTDSRRGLVRQLRVLTVMEGEIDLSPRHLDTLEDGSWRPGSSLPRELSANTERR